MNFTQKLKQWQALINQSLDQCLPVAEARPTRLHKAMHHSMQAGGKRLRPILVLPRMSCSLAPLTLCLRHWQSNAFIPTV